MKVLASDFDNTLLFEGKFKEEDLKSIKAFQQKGNLFGLCTGRPLNGIVGVVQDQMTFDFYILCTGAAVLDKNQQILFKNTITHDILEAIYARYEDNYRICIQANLKIYTKLDIDFEGLPLQHIESIDEVQGDIYGVSIECKDEEEARKTCEDIFLHIEDVTPHQNKKFIDVTAKGCSKGWGINKLKEAYGIERIAGIGDNYNDMPMLEVVDTAFTFPDSPQTVKDLCHHTVSGVKEAIELLEEE